MADFYEQPEYLKEIEEEPVLVKDEKPKPKTRMPFLLVVSLLIFIIIIALIVFFTGGRSNNNRGNIDTTSSSRDSSTPSPENRNKNIILQWWGVFLDKQVIEPLIEEYEVLNPGIKIEYVNKWPDAPFKEARDSYRTEINRVLKENDPVKIPDIFSVHNSWVSDYENYVRPSPNIDFDTFESVYYPSIVTDFANKRKKAIYGLPLWIDTLAIAYNKNILLSAAVSVPPNNWVSFKSLAQNLTVRNSGNIVQAGFSLGYAENTSFPVEMFFIIMRQNRVPIFNSQDQAIFAESSDTLTSLEYYKSFTNQSDGTWNANLPRDSQMFIEGKLAMIPVTSYRLREYLTANRNFNLDIDIGISQIPQLPGQTQPIYNWVDYWGNLVPLNRPYTSNTWDFLEWLNESNQQTKLHENIKKYYGFFGHLYPRKDMSNELKNDPYLKVFNESLPYAESWSMSKGIEIYTEFIKLLNLQSISQNNIVSTNNAINLIDTLKGKL